MKNSLSAGIYSKQASFPSIIEFRKSVGKGVIEGVLVIEVVGVAVAEGLGDGVLDGHEEGVTVTGSVSS
jgi:hypothetical protein